MFKIQRVKSTKTRATEFYSRCLAGPFLKNHSNTVGTALRRVLLSNLEGLAITGVRIKGISHEFSTIPNVTEDVVDLLLNLKQIILKGHVKEPTLVKFTVKEPGIIIASDIVLPNNITFVDPNQYIASSKHSNRATLPGRNRNKVTGKFFINMHRF